MTHDEAVRFVRSLKLPCVRHDRIYCTGAGLQVVSVYHVQAKLEAERALTDAAFDILNGWTGPWVDEWLARYQETRQR